MRGLVIGVVDVLGRWAAAETRDPLPPNAVVVDASARPDAGWRCCAYVQIWRGPSTQGHATWLGQIATVNWNPAPEGSQGQVSVWRVRVLGQWQDSAANWGPVEQTPQARAMVELVDACSARRSLEEAGLPVGRDVATHHPPVTLKRAVVEGQTG